MTTAKYIGGEMKGEKEKGGKGAGAWEEWAMAK